MKNLIIRECAIRACLAIKGGTGQKLLLDICNEALTGTKPDFSGDDWKYYDNAVAEPLYMAIAPDIKASVDDEPTDDEIADAVFEAVMDTVGDLMGDVAPNLTVIGSHTEVSGSED